MDNKYIVAFELSGSQIKGGAARIDATSHALPVVEQIVAEECANCVQYGVVHNLIEATNSTTQVLQKLANTSTLQDGAINGVYMGVAGRSLASMHTSAELTLPTEMEITDQICENLAKEAAKHAPSDKKVLKVLPRKYYVNNKAVTNPVGSLGSMIKGDFTVVLCNAANQRNQEKVATERMHMPIKDFIITPLAIADLVLTQEEKQLGCMLVDLGAETTTVSIYKDRALQWLITLPIGSKNITHDIVNGLKTTEEKAEHFKVSQGDATPNKNESGERSQTNKYIQARALEIIANINAQIGYAGYKASDLTGGIILTGRGSKLTHFDDALANYCKVDKVRYAHIPSSISVEARDVVPTDYISLLAIIAEAASNSDEKGCVDFNAPIQENPVQSAPQNPDPFNVDIEDDTLLDDDEEVLKKRARAQEEAAKRQRKEEEKARKEEIERRRKEEKALKKANHRSLLDRLKDKVAKIVDDSEDSDASIM